MNLKKLENILAELKKNAASAEEISAVMDALVKARKRADEYDPNAVDDDDNELGDGFREFNADEEEGDDADKWLEQNDPDRKGDNSEESEEDSEEPEAELSDSKPASSKRVPDLDSPEAETSQAQAPQEGQVKPSRFPQPSKEEITDMRSYTRPWEQNARDITRLKAEAHKNPVLHHEGQIVEARNKAHKNFNDAYHEFSNSPDYQNADPISQMEMEDKFKNDWHTANPDHLINAVRSHGEAHDKGLKAKDIHAAAKDEQFRHVVRGGAQSEDAMSMEEAMQHAGGSKTDEGTTGSITQDGASAFAHGNQDLLNQIGGHARKYESTKDFDSKMKQLRGSDRKAMLEQDPDLDFAEKNQNVIRRVVRGNERAKAGHSMDDIMSYGGDHQEKNLEGLLGDHPNLKDPAKRAKVDKFFKQYYPLINMSANHVLDKLGIDKNKRSDLDLGAMHEAGVHGLFQAINDYQHDNPNKTSFSSHAGNKIRGLMQTAMRGMDQVPSEIRSAAKKKSASEMMSKHPGAERLARVNTQRAAHGVQAPAAAAPTAAPATPSLDVGLPAQPKKPEGAE